MLAGGVMAVRAMTEVYADSNDSQARLLCLFVHGVVAWLRVMARS